MVRVWKFAATVIDAEPSKVTLLIVTGVDNLVAVVAVPALNVILVEPSKVTPLIVTGVANLNADVAGPFVPETTRPFASVVT